MANFEGPAATDPNVANAKRLLEIERRLSLIEKEKELIISPFDIPDTLVGSTNTVYKNFSWTGGRLYVNISGYSKMSNGSNGLPALIIRVKGPDNNYNNLTETGSFTPSIYASAIPTMFVRIDQALKNLNIAPGTLNFSFDNTGYNNTEMVLGGYFIEWPTG